MARFQFKLACVEDGLCVQDCGPGQSCKRTPAMLAPQAERLLALGNRARRLERDLRREGFNAAARAVRNAITKIEGLPT